MVILSSNHQTLLTPKIIPNNQHLGRAALLLSCSMGLIQQRLETRHLTLAWARCIGLFDVRASCVASTWDVCCGLGSRRTCSAEYGQGALTAASSRRLRSGGGVLEHQIAILVERKQCSPFLKCIICRPIEMCLYANVQHLEGGEYHGHAGWRDSYLLRG